MRIEKSTLLFYAAIGMIIVFIVLKPLCPSIQRLSMDQFHLKNKSFCAWAALQVVPSMYNFANEFWYSPTALEEGNLPESPYSSWEGAHLWVNHYPLRLMSFGLYRRGFYAYPQSYIYLRSRYRSTTATTVYQVFRKDNVLFLK